MQTVCADDTCANTNTDSMNCGECGNACGTGTTCGSGHCVDATLSCANIHLVDATKPSGPYVHAADNHQFFCDMDDGPMQYEELGFGQYNVAHPGWDFVGAADMSKTAIQNAFVYLFNKQAGGLTTIATFISTNCCFKASATAALNLTINGSYVIPTTTNSTTQMCSPMAGYTAANYGFFMETAGIYSTTTLPDGYFTANPVAETAVCTDGNNPAMFFRRHL